MALDNTPGIDDEYDDIFSRLEKEFESRFKLFGFIIESDKRVPIFLDNSSGLPYLFRTDREHSNFLAINPSYFSTPTSEFFPLDTLLDAESIIANPIKEFNFNGKFLFVKDTPLSSKFGIEVYGCLQFECVEIPSGDFSTEQVKIKFKLNHSESAEFSIKDLCQFYEQKLISKVSLSLLINKVLIELSQRGIATTYEHWYKTMREIVYNEFYLPSGEQWDFAKLYAANRYNQAELAYFNFASRINSIGEAYILAKNAASDKRRIVLDPFELHSDSGNLVERDFSTAKAIVSRIKMPAIRQNDSHFGHDSVAFANGNPDDAYLIDGMGGHVGAYFISELLGRFLAEGNDINDSEAWEKFYKANSKVKVPKFKTYSSPGAVLVNSKIDRVKNLVHLSSVGDPTAIHFDSEMKIVQYVGSNSVGMPQSVEGDLSDRKSRQTYDRDRLLYKDNANIPAAFMSSKGITGAEISPVPYAPYNTNISGLVCSGAEFRPGDSVLLSSDLLEKLFSENYVKILLIYFYKEKNQQIDVNNIDFSVMPKYVFTGRTLVTGSEQKTWLSGNSLIPFFILVHHLKKIGVINNIDDLYALFKFYLPSSKDDGSIVIQK